MYKIEISKELSEYDDKETVVIYIFISGKNNINFLSIFEHKILFINTTKDYWLQETLHSSFFSRYK